MRPLRKLLTALAVAAIGTAGYLYARPEPSPGPTASGAAEVESEAVPVTVAAAVRKPCPVALTVIGNVEAYSTVAIKSRVDGEILSAGFKEGQTVHKGDLLFSIDPRPFEAALRQAEANLSRDKAQLEGAKLDLDRYSKLAKSGFGTQQKYEESQTAVDALQATIQADQAAIDVFGVNILDQALWKPAFQAGLAQSAAAADEAVVVSARVHAKCGRCWHYREDVGRDGVGADAAHPADHPERAGAGRQVVEQHRREDVDGRDQQCRAEALEDRAELLRQGAAVPLVAQEHGGLRLSLALARVPETIADMGARLPNCDISAAVAARD